MLLGLDVGTTAVKAVLIDGDARVRAVGSAEYPLSHPQPDWSQQDAEDWWRGAVAATRQAISQAASADISAIAVSTQGDTMAPVDANGVPLAPARTWMDRRTAHLVPGLLGRVDAQRWRQIAGSPPAAYAAALTVIWLRESMPDVYRDAHRFALVADFVLQRLTGQPGLDYPNASRTLLFDIHARDWSDDLLAAVQVGRDRLSPVMPSGTSVGTLSQAAADALGITPGIPCAVGGHDQTCAAVGAGVVRPGAMLLSCGTAWVELVATESPLLDAASRVQTYCHAAPDRWSLLTAHAGGNILKWLQETLCPGMDYGQIVDEARAAEADEKTQGTLVFLPHFYGGSSPDWMRSAKGALGGLTLGHTRGSVTLSALRGVALEVRRQLASFWEIGAGTDEIRMIGGGARSLFWAQMIADVSRASVRLPEVREAAGFGAAILAGVASGAFSSVDEVVSALPIRATLEPSESSARRYDEHFERYCDTIDHLRPVWERMRSAGDGSADEDT